MFDEYLVRWGLTPDGDPITTPYSRLLPVLQQNVPAMLKIALAKEERVGAAVMVWWGGRGAARVLAHDGSALLLERAIGPRSLALMARIGHDDDASRIICGVAAQLHAPRSGGSPDVVPLTRWFESLEPAASRYGGVLASAATAARGLLQEPQDVVLLHGDIHHGNVLDAGNRGWMAIDPKGIRGERGFDFANVFCNPDLTTAAAPGRLAHQASVVAHAANLDRTRLLRWILAYAGLSAAWTLDDGDDPTHALAVAEIAAAEIDRA